MEAEMPKQVSEATAETAQVEKETPSEAAPVVETEPPAAAQVVEPEPSEAEAPAQEPSDEEKLAKLSDEEVKALPDEHPIKRLAKRIADKSTLKLRGEFEARETVRTQAQEREQRLTEARQQREREAQTYSQLLELRQTKPEEFVKALDNPEYRGVWDRGGRIAPSTEEIENARSDGFSQLYGTYYRMLMSKPELTNLSDEEAASIASNKFKGMPDAHGAYLDAITDLLATKKAQALVAKERKGIEEEARKNEREKLQAKYREAGVVPEDIEGKAAPGVLTEAQYLAMSPADREKLQQEHPERIDAMTKRMMGI